MNWLTKLFEPKEKVDWRLVKEIRAGFIHYEYRKLDPEKRINEREEELVYFLYEDQNGNRKFDAVCSLNGDIDINDGAAKRTWVFRSEEYRYTIRPWLDGRYDPDIPDYETIPKNDFQNRIAKKKIK